MENKKKPKGKSTDSLICLKETSKREFDKLLSEGNKIKDKNFKCITRIINNINKSSPQVRIMLFDELVSLFSSRISAPPIYKFGALERIKISLMNSFEKQILNQELEDYLSKDTQEEKKANYVG